MIYSLFKKEFIDAIRDKRSIFAALAGAFISPILFGAMMIFTIESATSLDELYVDISGGEQAPYLIKMLEDQEIIHHAKPEKGKKITVNDEESEHSLITLAFDENFAENLKAGKAATVVLTADYSKKGMRDKVSRIKRVIGGYQSQLVGMKLVARGVSPSVMKTVELQENDTSTPSSKSAMLLGMLGVMMLISVFVSSTNVAIDCSAGERERNSLELLLMQPVNTMDVVVAKALNTAFFGALGATLSVMLTAIIIPFIPLHKIGMAFHFDIELALIIWSLLMPLAIFAAAIQLVAAFHAKSFKEAQSYIQYTVMIPIIIPMMLEVVNYKNAILSYMPIFAQQQAISQLIRGELENFTPFVIGSVITVLASLAIVKFISRSLRSEKVVLGL
jgi:sodium transport system permease protein